MPPKRTTAGQAHRPLSWAGAILAAARGALARPGTWPVALAAFLARGGIVALVLPIVILPTPSGIANVLMPSLTAITFGRISVELVVLIGGLALGLASAVLVGGLVGAWLDSTLVREAALGEELGPDRVLAPDRPGIAWRALAVRLVAYAPLAVAIGWGASRLVSEGYAELSAPNDISIPLAVRVLGRAPETGGLIVVTWLAGEALGGLAIRQLVLRGTSVPRALIRTVGYIIRRPLTSVATTIVTDAVLAIAVGTGLFASVIAVERLQFVLAAEASELDKWVALLLMAAVWVGTLVVGAAVTAFRSVAWTFEVARGRLHDV